MRKAGNPTRNAKKPPTRAPANKAGDNVILENHRKDAGDIRADCEETDLRKAELPGQQQDVCRQPEQRVDANGLQKAEIICHGPSVPIDRFAEEAVRSEDQEHEEQQEHVDVTLVDPEQQQEEILESADREARDNGAWNAAQSPDDGDDQAP